MFFNWKKIVAVILCVITAAGLFGGCAKNRSRSNLKVIRIATHAQKEIDPNWTDPVTGEPFMSPEQLRAANAAVDAVAKQLGVKLEFVQYPGDVREVLLQSVLANDPIAELVIMWNGSQGTILGQNILQPLDKYINIFTDDPDAQWILVDKVYGHYYFLNRDLLFIKTWPLVYNIKYIEAVDALKENGQTVYPSDLYARGEWTWSKFEDYLSKVAAYYSGKYAPVRSDVPIKAFQTDYRYTAMQALHSVGAAVYGPNGMEFDTADAKKAIEYIDSLMTKGLMMSVRYSNTDSTPGWTWQANDFANGETVFTNMVLWMGNSSSNKMAQRGESMGIVPFPRPDYLAPGDPKYQQTAVIADCVGVLKGVPEETVKLALEAYKIYKNTYYKTLANAESINDYIEKNAESEALAFGIDIFHEKVGENNLKAFKDISSQNTNEFAEGIGIFGAWSKIVGDSIYGLNGTPKYAVAIEAKKSDIYNILTKTESIIASGEIRDNISPKFSKVTSEPIAFAAGSDPSNIDWSAYLKAEDNVDGVYDIKQATIDLSRTDFSKVGKYDGGLVATIKDAAGNEGKTTQTVIIYDPNNKTAPTIKPKGSYRTVKKDEDVSKINWASDFVESATDKDGFDIKSRVTANVTELDVTTPGTYNVELTATDFVGNQAKVTIPVTVAEE